MYLNIKMTEILITYCESGNVNEVKHIYNLYKNKIDLHHGNEYIFKYCCTHGFLDIAQFLFDTDNTINIRSEDDYAFRWSCINGYLDVAKWLIEIGNKMKTPINIHASDESAFVYSCMFGNFEIIKWLYDLSIILNSPINIHALNESAFIDTCRKGHYVIMEWLYDLGISTNSPIDIRALDDYAFIYACKHQFINIARFLASKCDLYILDTDTDRIISYFIIKLRDVVEGKTREQIIDIIGLTISKNEINNNNNDYCFVCLDTYDVVLECRHKCCFDCFIKWYIVDDNIKQCVLCMKPVIYRKCNVLL